MTFQEKYISVTKAIDGARYLEATQIYNEILAIFPDRILKLTKTSETACRIHHLLATKYAYQKLLVQRIRGHKEVSLNLASFTSRLAMAVKYGTVTEYFLDGWKGSCGAWLSTKRSFIDLHQQIFEAYSLNSLYVEPLDADIYVSGWTVRDFLDFESLLPLETSNYVGIGSGCSIFDTVAFKCLVRASEGYCVDTDERCKSVVNELADLNDLSRLSFSTDPPSALNGPTTVVSIRSCAFLYKANEYESFFKSLASGSTVLLDVAHHFRDETISFFEQIGATATPSLRQNASLQAYIFEF